MRRSLAVFLLLWATLFWTTALDFGTSVWAAADSNKSDFVLAPYVQLGDSPGNSRVICWSLKGSDSCQLEFRSADSEWKKGVTQEEPLYAIPNCKFFSCKIAELKPGDKIQYRLSRGGKPLFESVFNFQPKADSEYSFALLGDIGYGGKKGTGMTEQIAGINPDLLVFTGDLLPPNGTMAGYSEKFFPKFNDPSKTALLSKTATIAAPGDRDVSADKYDAEHDNRNLDLTKGNLAYFAVWKHPLNGPGKPGAINVPLIQGTELSSKEFLKAAGKSYPTSANFSFDFGNSHWLVLDGGPYVDWHDTGWRNWVQEDLASSRKDWKFVVFHQPGFSSDTTHGEEQRMRLLSEVFESGGVDIVFSGHSNSYQRSCPFKFALDPSQDSDRESKLGFVYGKYKMDKVFDGVSHLKPDGVIYLISGGGGDEPAELRIQEDQTRWQPFTRKFYCQKSSFTTCKVIGRKLDLKQVAEDGTVVDQVRIEK